MTLRIATKDYRQTTNPPPTDEVFGILQNGNCLLTARIASNF